MEAESVCARLNAAWAGRETESNWTDMEKSLRDLQTVSQIGLAAALRAHGTDALAAALNSERTRVVLSALDAVKHSAGACGKEWFIAGEFIMLPLLKQCERTARLVAERARTAAVECARACASSGKKQVLAVIGQLYSVLGRSLSPAARQAAVECLCAVLQETISMGDQCKSVDICDLASKCLAAALNDSAQGVRSAGRTAFHSFRLLFPEPASEIAVSLPPAMRRTLIEMNSVSRKSAHQPPATSTPALSTKTQPPAISRVVRAAQRVLLTPIQAATKNDIDNQMLIPSTSHPNNASKPDVRSTGDAKSHDTTSTIVTCAIDVRQSTQMDPNPHRRAEHTPAEIRVFVEGVKSDNAAVRAAALNSFATIMRAAEDTDRVIVSARTATKVRTRLFDILQSGLHDNDPDVVAAMHAYALALLNCVPLSFLADYDTHGAVQRCIVRLQRQGTSGVYLAAAIIAWAARDSSESDCISVLQRSMLKDPDWTMSVCRAASDMVPALTLLDRVGKSDSEEPMDANCASIAEKAHILHGHGVEYVAVDEEVSLRSSCSSLCLAMAPEGPEEAHVSDNQLPSGMVQSGQSSGQVSVSAHLQMLSIDACSTVSPFEM